jgi:hypothetical protein
MGDLAVWRAATNVPDNDHRPTGPAQPAKADAQWQRDLDARLGSSNAATIADWTSLIHELVPAARRDDYTPRLAEHLAELSDAGIDARTLLRTTTGAPLPDDHAASALWWRLQRHLPDPQDPNGPGPLEWASEDVTTAPDRRTGLDAPRRSGANERRIIPARHDQPRGPSPTR